MTRAVNDATLQKAGDIYQYLIALRDCFELNDGDTLQIETNGDVSIINDVGGRFQREVKHHFGNTSISDRDIDFWKTLANWYVDYERVKNFSNYILSTTATIKSDSPFHSWNNIKKTEKLKCLKDIGATSKKTEETFRNQYNRIFGDSYDESRLLEILDKFTIEAAKTSIDGISNTLKAQLKQKYKKQKANEKSTAYIKENLSPLLTDYFALLEQDFDGKISVQKMLKIASDLPEFDDTQLFGENKIAERYSELNAVLENLRNEEREILLKIKNIDNAFDTGSSFTQMLKDLKQQTSIAEIETDEYTCPLCGHECKEIAENDSKLIEATEWLDNELRITEKYTSDFSEDVRKLKEAHSKIDEKIRDVWKQIKTIEEKFISSKALVSKREKVNYAKARIALYAEMSSSGIFETVDGDIEELKEKIARLEEKIKGFDVDKKMSKAESFLSNNMNRLSLTLDFEEEYRPIDLNFGLTDGSFDIYQHQKSNENIHLYEMGSGANWVSCHIALFLSFLRFFATQDNSPMPLVMFFDQPSQVYFPQGNDKDEITQADLIAVNKMYKTKNDFFTEQWAMTSGTLHSCRVDLLTQYSLLLTMVSLLEEAVNTLCRLYHNINHLDKEVKDIKGSGLERAAKYLKDVVGIDGFTADKQWEYITVIRDARNMVVYNGGRIYKEFDKYDKFKIGYREEDHQLYLEYNDIVKMYDAILDFMDRTFRIIPQG